MKTNNPYTPFDEQLREQLTSLNPEVPEGVWEAMESSLDALNQNLQFDSAIRETVDKLQIPAPEGVFQAVQSQLGSGILSNGLSIAGKWILGSVLAGTVATSVWFFVAKENAQDKNELVVVSETKEEPAASEKMNALEDDAPENALPIHDPETNTNSGAGMRTGAELSPAGQIVDGGQVTDAPVYTQDPGSNPQVNPRANQGHTTHPQPQPSFSFSASDTMLCAGQVYTFFISNADNCVYDVLINGIVVGKGKRGTEKFRYETTESGLYHVQCLLRYEDEVWKKTQFLHVNPLPEVKLSKSDLGSGRYAFEAGEGMNTLWYLDGGKKVEETIQLYDELPKDHKMTACVSNKFGCTDSASIEFRNNFVFDIRKPVIPNVFTPNGDGGNDVFRVEIKGATYYHIKIYNSQTQLVFESKDPKEVWDGKDKYKGNRIEPGIYTYFIEYALAGGEIIRESKTITLIKE